MIICDAIQDLSRGDCGKGKVAYSLAQKPEYSVVMRHCGSQNAGHTIYHNDNKFATHMISAGVFWNKTSIIGPQCMFNTKALFDEIDKLEKYGINVYSNLKIDFRAHMITDKHLQEDSTEIRIGSTRRGVGPCARDKYDRIGNRAESEPLLKELICDCIEYLHSKNNTVLCEGAQGYYLSVDSKEYPYVTSADVTLGSIIASGIPPQTIRNVFGVAKAYETYVGSKKFQPDGDVFNEIADYGDEYGATTGRRRQCNWLNWNELMYAAKACGVTDLILNKIDVLEKINKPCIIKDGALHILDDINHFKIWVISNMPAKMKVKFSYTPYEI